VIGTVVPAVSMFVVTNLDDLVLLARSLARWGHVLLPVVLMGIGVAILVEGGAFGL
jgi:cadmium resistance protein CadD (predicted permease)